MAEVDLENGMIPQPDRERTELEAVVERIYSRTLRKQLGEAAPSTIHALLASHGVDVKILDLLMMTLTATLELPIAHRVEARRALTDEEFAVLKAGGFDPSKTRRSSEPFARGIADYASLVANSLSVSDAAKHLKVEASRVRQRLGDRTAYGFKYRGTWKLPSFQFDKNGLVPDIDLVTRSLPTDLHPVAVLTWFTSPNVDLPSPGSKDAPMSPLDWLRSGNEPKIIVELATAL
ncbi:MAG: hypothetical protein KAI47_02855 [Deltaproteobacteria bacterium]|nr:hypothetical protein [Deltaproteobacteria bacterium]